MGNADGSDPLKMGSTMLSGMALTIQTTPMIIGGKRVLASDEATVDSRNPATGDLIGRFPSATTADVNTTVAAASAAFASWKRTEPDGRAAALNALADLIELHQSELADLDVLDNGSPIREMRKDVVSAAKQLRYFAGLVLETRGETVPTSYDRLNYTLLQPYGVVARIIPFNHPLKFAASKIAAPLAAGNTVILKPSEHSSMSALRLAELAIGVLPDGVLNVLTGYGHTAGDALVRHPAIRRLAFTGAADTGRAIQAAAASSNVKNITLELGGKNPLVVFSGANMARAIESAVRGMNFTWQGQSCGSTSRLLVQRDVYPDFVEALGRAVNALRTGLPDKETTETGAIINERQFEKVKKYIGIGHAQGARLVAGGDVVTDGEFANGYFVRPTVFADVDPYSRLAQEEIFGPILAVMPFSDYDEAISIANGVHYGLTSSVFSNDLRTVHRFARDVQAGYVWANEVSVHVPGTDFGGVKDSGLGREGGVQELLSYTESKNVHVNFEE